MYLKNTTAKLFASALRREPEYQLLSESLGHYAIERFRQSPAYLTGLCDSALGFLIPALLSDLTEKGALSERALSLLLVPDEKTAAAYVRALSPLMDGVYLFPMRDLVFHNVEAFSHEFEYDRLEVLRHMDAGEARLIIAVPEAVLTILPPRDVCGGEFRIAVGDTLPIDALLRRLSLYGYHETDTVEGKGQFAHRGDIVDIFPPDKDAPLRLEFFGDELDACGSFGVLTQRRVENVNGFLITPSREILITDEQKKICTDALSALITRAEKKKKAAEKAGNKLDAVQADERLSSLNREYEAFQSDTVVCLDKYLPLLDPEGHCLLSMVDGAVFAVDYPKVSERLQNALKLMNETVIGLMSEGLLNLDGSNGVYLHDEAMLHKALMSRPSFVTSFFTSRLPVEISGIYDFLTKQTAPFDRGMDTLKEDLFGYLDGGFSVLALVHDEKSARTLAEELSEGGTRHVYAMTPSDLASQGLPEKGSAVLIPDELYGKDGGSFLRGFELTKSSFVLLTESPDELSSGRKTRALPSGRKKTAGQAILSYQDLKVGDYVVHVVHGIARYEGIKTLTVDKVTRDYIMLQYAGTDILYVPVDQLDRVSRYAGAGESVRLSSMTTKDWQKTKSRAKSAARDMAKQLIELYAARMRQPGYAFGGDTEWQKDFEGRFEYEETDGQIDAVREIKEDMESSHPMDRLLCGDVGFGKTEVALRAVFKCVIEGKQAAILVPTTILAMQHYRTVVSRMKGFPFKIDMLSRFCKPKEAKAILQRLATGETDIVIGTHKLLGKTVAFRDLGLLVVDEEQRFGVAHKERLKELSHNIDVLTLTATPIPRTLNMAMAGIRDMSVLEEAPTNRYPVQTYVMEHDEGIILEAIRRELRRAGQVFYLRNRVDGIENTAAKLRAAFPDAVIAIAHGQMDQEDLSDIWTAMIEGQIDILVCTTIIETGVDVPNANTLIIEDADKMGLSQLHQIRGRIGRSNRRAYAYITWRRSATLTEIASKRLEALREFTEFGSGFKIAMRDLEIRGAGNLLGAEQSGHIEAVGYDLYIRLLEEAVLEEKGVKPEEKPEASVDLRENAYIPERYIRLPKNRIEMYKKIAGIRTDEEKDDVFDELCDRYGVPPKEVSNLLSAAVIRAKCEKLGIRRIDQKEQKLVITPIALPKKAVTVSLALFYKGRVLYAAGQAPGYNLRLLPGESASEAALGFLNEYEKALRAAEP